MPGAGRTVSGPGRPVHGAAQTVSGLSQPVHGVAQTVSGPGRSVYGGARTVGRENLQIMTRVGARQRGTGVAPVSIVWFLKMESGATPDLRFMGGAEPTEGGLTRSLHQAWPRAAGGAQSGGDSVPPAPRLL